MKGHTNGHREGVAGRDWWVKMKRTLRFGARDLHVGTIVEGSLQIVGDRLRVNVQLIDAATDEHLWARHFDRRLDYAFAAQSDIAHGSLRRSGPRSRVPKTKRLLQPLPRMPKPTSCTSRVRNDRTRAGRFVRIWSHTRSHTETF
jgi:hypothetical protein